MAQKKENPKQKLKKQLSVIADTVDFDSVNKSLKDMDITTIDISKKTLMNIGRWILDGKSEIEVRQNLELTPNEWSYLLKTCPAIVFVMQHSTTYADMVVGGTLLQTAIGGKVIKKKIPLKVRDYVDGKVVGEHYEMVEVEEESQPNPYLLKFLAEHKLSEQFGSEKKDNTKAHREIIDAMTEDEIEAINEYKK